MAELSSLPFSIPVPTFLYYYPPWYFRRGPFLLLPTFCLMDENQDEACAHVPLLD
jgi:hypothetical protein